MSKFVLFASLLFLAYGVSAASVSTGEENSLSTLLATIETLLPELVEHVVEFLKTSIEKLAADAAEQQSSWESSWDSAIKKQFEDADAQLEAVQDSVDSSACVTLRNDVKEEAEKVRAGVVVCMSTAVEQGKVIAKEFISTIQSWIDEYNTYSARKDACDDLAGSTIGNILSEACHTLVETEAKAKVLILVSTTKEIAAKFVALQTEIAACTTSNLITEWEETKDTSLAEIEACIAEIASEVEEV